MFAPPADDLTGDPPVPNLLLRAMNHLVVAGDVAPGISSRPGLAVEPDDRYGRHESTVRRDGPGRHRGCHPDGLDSSLRTGCTFDADDNITGGSCPAQQTKDHELADSPLADYGVKGVENAYLSTGLSGIAGVLITFALGGGLFWLTRRRGTRAGPELGAAATTSAAAVSGC
ncbi:PDGLE domain-containing protein [Micromonospora sp. NPDC050417]|uniref:PDGLE domain-containing protein n=1 Tax=Micromonospora sp. NPDC050417 TaxID=3364280 RepID=UPI00379D0323